MSNGALDMSLGVSEYTDLREANLKNDLDRADSLLEEEEFEGVFEVSEAITKVKKAEVTKKVKSSDVRVVQVTSSSTPETEVTSEVTSEVKGEDEVEGFRMKKIPSNLFISPPKDSLDFVSRSKLNNFKCRIPCLMKGRNEMRVIAFTRM